MTAIRTSQDAYQRRRLPNGATIVATHRPLHERATILYGSNHAREALESASGKSPVDAIAAWVQHGEWIAQCPDCLSAQLVHLEQAGFFCSDCGNELVGGALRALRFPRNRERIEQLLLIRPRRANRNWLPNEQLEDLERENLVHSSQILNGRH